MRRDVPFEYPCPVRIQSAKDGHEILAEDVVEGAIQNKVGGTVYKEQ